MQLGRRIVDAARSPARLLAFVARAIGLLRRGELGAVWQRARPQSPSPSDYRAWRAAQPPCAPVDASIRVVLLVDAGAAPFAACLPDLVAHDPAVLGMLERDGPGAWRVPGRPETQPLSHWLTQWGCGSGEAAWLMWIVRPTRLEPDALRALVSGAQEGGALVVYADHDRVDDDDRPARPCFAPAFDRERLLEQSYMGPVLLVHASLAAQLDAAGACGGAAAWRFLLEAQRKHPDDVFVHVPRVVAHVPPDERLEDVQGERAAVADVVLAVARDRGAGVDAAPEREPWLRYELPGDTVQASVVVPTRDGCKLLRRCLESLIERTAGVRYELVVVDNGSTDPAVADLLERVRPRVALTVVRRDEPFNFPRLCNAGVAAASGRVVVLLNNDTEILHGDWLGELTALAGRPDVGAVGPLLLYPDGTIQSAGVLLGVNRTSSNALAAFPPGDLLAKAWCSARRRVSAVMGACLAVERRKYLDAGGLDEAFSVSHNELDFCLRLEAGGAANVFTPFARVRHDEGGTRGFEVTPEERRRLDREERLFRDRWGAILQRTDPAHHPALRREGNAFALASGPADGAPRCGWRRPPACALLPGQAAGR